MSVVEGKTHYVLYDLNLDLRPWDVEEWGVFDGFMYECDLNIDKRRYYKKLKPCGFRWFQKQSMQKEICPRCGARSGNIILNGEILC